MKLKPRVLIAPLLAIFFGVILIFFDKNTGGRYKANLRMKYVNSFINRDVNGIITKVYRTDMENISRGEIFRSSIQINYADTKTGDISNVDTKLEYEDYINVGDTISKRRGEEVFHIKKRAGNTKTFSIN